MVPIAAGIAGVFVIAKHAAAAVASGEQPAHHGGRQRADNFVYFVGHL